MTYIQSLYFNAAKIKSQVLGLLAFAVLLFSVTPAFSASALPSATWGYPIKNIYTYSNIDDEVRIDYLINTSAQNLTNIALTFPWVTGATYSCSRPGSQYVCEVRYKAKASDIGAFSIDLTASATAIADGSPVNLFQYTTTFTPSSNQSPVFIYVAPVVVYPSQTITHTLPSSVPVTGGPVSIGALSLEGGQLFLDVLSDKANHPGYGVCSLERGAGNLPTGKLNLGNVGTCVVEIYAFEKSSGGVVTYAATSKTVNMTVTQATQDITFAALDDRQIDAGGFDLTATSSSDYLPVSFASLTTGTCTVSGSTVSLVSTGECQIEASQAGDSNFEAASSVTQSFDITRPENIITFDAITDDKTTLTEPFALSASATSGLPVSFSTSSDACSVSESTVTVLGLGACVIDANEGGDALYKPAAPVQRSFTIVLPPNNISVPRLNAKRIGDAPFGIEVSGSSTAPVILTSNTTSICTVTGHTVSLLAVGSCQLVANQAADDVYPAAPSANISFAIDKAYASIAQDDIATPIFATQIITLTARVTGYSPTGTVEFYVDKSSVGSSALNNGVATLSYTVAEAGDHHFSVGYSGDDNNEKSGTKSRLVTVDARPANASQNTSARSGAQAQARTMGRYGAAQNTNIAKRLQSTRSGDTENSFAAMLNVDGAPQIAGLVAAGQQMTGLGKGSLPFGVWVGGTFGFGSQDNATSGSDKFNTSGITFGIDHKFTDQLLLGVALGVAVDETKIGNDGSEVDGKNYSAALYGSYQTSDQSYLDLLVGYGSGKMKASRYDTLGAIMLHGARDTEQYFGTLAFTYDQKFDALTLSPYAKIRAEHSIADAYAEGGGSIWALGYGKMDTTSVNAVVGMNAKLDIPVSWGMLVTTGGLEYSTQVAGDYSQSVGYADGAGGVFTLTDAGTSSQQLTAAVGLATTVDQFTFDVNYKYSIADFDAKAHAISGSMRVEF